MSIYLVCPKCASRDIEPVSSSNELGYLRHKLLGRKPYLCGGCHWRGYIGHEGNVTPLDWILSALLITIISVLILVLLKIY